MDAPVPESAATPNRSQRRPPQQWQPRLQKHQEQQLEDEPQLRRQPLQPERQDGLAEGQREQLQRQHEWMAPIHDADHPVVSLTVNQSRRQSVYSMYSMYSEQSAQ